jgi:hypothetical protein
MLPQLAMQLPSVVMVSQKLSQRNCQHGLHSTLHVDKNERNRIRNVGIVKCGPCAQFPCDSFLDNMVLSQKLRSKLQQKLPRVTWP